MSKASKKMLRQQRLIAQIKSEHGTRGVWLNAEQFAMLENNIEKRVAGDAVIRALLAIANAVYYDFGKLQKKDTRLKTYFELARDYLQNVDKPTERMQELEKLIEKDVGFRFERTDE